MAGTRPTRKFCFGVTFAHRALSGLFLLSALFFPVYGEAGPPTAAQLQYALSCQPCHGDRHGKGTVGRAAPHNEKGHTWHHPDAQLKEWILHGKPGPGLSVMPGFNYLREKDLQALLRLIKSWWTEEQREIQADISRRYDQAVNKKKEPC